MPKRGRAHNELTGYRYDAVLEVGPRAAGEKTLRWVGWEDVGSPEELRALALESKTRPVGVRRVPNARVLDHVRTAQWLRGESEERGDGGVERAVDPEDLWGLRDAYGVTVEISWANGAADGAFDVAFGAAGGVFAGEDDGREWSEYANRPLEGTEARSLVPRLRQRLHERLPDYMVPSAFVVLDEIPLTPNGKLDQRALESIELGQPSLDEGFAAPRTPTEEAVASVWREVLGLERVGVHDDFFARGGHSLLAAQVVSRLREVFRVDLPLRDLFEAPTVAGFSERVDAARRRDVRVGPPVSPVSRERELPLSYSQQRLWVLDQVDPGDCAYNMGLVLRLGGELDRGALERSLTEIVRRHESLRTVFESVGGEPRQRVLDPGPCPLPLDDLEAVPAPTREREARRRVREEVHRPFPLASGPLFRARLLRLERQDHIFVTSVHHIVCDGWSFDVLTRELAQLYEAFSRGRPSPLPELAVQYADYAVWQRKWMEEEVLARQLAYWKGRLGGGLRVLELPSDRPRPSQPTHRGASEHVVLPAPLAGSLRALSRTRGATLFMTLLATFKVLMSRYCGQDDVVVGTPVANRGRVETEGLIGFFINTLVLRSDLSGDPTFLELLDRVKETALGAYDHQDLPFERLVEELQPERSLARSPLFQVFFNMVPPVAESPSLPGLAVRPVDAGFETSKFDLTLYAADTPSGLLVSLNYATDLFEAATARRMLAHYRHVLETVASEPGRRLSAIDPLPPGERRGVAEEARRPMPARRSRPPLPEDWVEASLSRRFGETAKAHADRVAVEDGERRWTYAELERSANAVAGALRRGGRPSSVALLLDHGAPLVAAVLGALRAGCRYVPLGASAPPDWLAFVVEDAEVDCLLADAANLELARRVGGPARRVIDVGEGISEAPLDPPLEEPGADALAYILYTSGSTGRPKGVMQSHRNVLGHVRNYMERVGVGPTDRVTLLSSLTFDAAVVDVFSALLAGGTLLPYDLRQAGVEGLPAWLEAARPTVYHSTPTIFRSFLRGRPPGAPLDGVEVVVLGGESVLSSDLDLVRRHFGPGCAVVNGLGSTESTFHLMHVADPRSERPDKEVPVGHPLPSTEVVLLDEQGRRAVVRGEIAVRSSHVALGYWRRPDLTAEAFVPDPDGNGARLYRTGDLARRRLDDGFVFEGRRDLQVKVRGVRIEPAEIESVLGEHAGVEGCAVALHTDRSGDPLLVAYVVRRESHAPDAEELRRFLRTRLPESMVPGRFVTLEALPLTPSRKLDRRALPAPPLGEGGDGDFVPPRDAEEEAVAAIWRELLGLERVSVHHSFFELGGHSLTATQVISRIRDRLQVELPLRRLFEAPTVAGLAEHLRQARAQEASTAPPRIRRRPRASASGITVPPSMSPAAEGSGEP
jgi:amino acid adenylation domain-containing protein